MKLSKHFSREEFACKCKCGTPFEIDPFLILLLEDIRSYFEWPITVHSGFRCPKHNKAVKGALKSQHLLGKAADISVSCNSNTNELYEIANMKNWAGGVIQYPEFVHVDVRGKVYREIK